MLYQGQRARLLVELGLGEVIVDMPITDSINESQLPQKGEQVVMSIDPDKIMILNEETDQ